MRRLIMVVALAFWPLASCDDGIPDVAQHCDYCVGERMRVSSFKCQQCESMHRSCLLERNLWERGWNSVQLLACPSPPGRDEK